ncbi:UDP-N-acetylglucosamine 1-carboxyvinyltransferase [Longicatena sp. 210702-DFI.1.36]|uniref:UDP-N-acetylglucosamine 1-carboxyvinyltransferase n=1 Tax=Longicatena TaxID=1918536 RepID=UPI001D08B6CE|nr:MULTISPECIES: UDP-N-acetylglucosamine 1-carboxyvinyltransferase [Longicatena]MCB6266448.1 UDP-N-acetylglucosamine 1-carboxyvinyltransferase [Longicatena sp. 210702-DFI.1.160]MCB6317012.1 UDP-N-acetylglucosamine 1-carboxyvinyltransferase [Longicatena sp. 210702-DFI.1.100]MCB6430936.1 UDP-N-acetylglucosamine 1-carboxyvinyltransferase [Longicatena sp. 210702-DFI.1.36]MCB6433949.1 UDP-N-acetylglucosamine 1-carboxyvinyltransferase [Longicatena sp. 210702-DFI.1.249]MCB6440443.1 UDP-N-acetylglucos
MEEVIKIEGGHKLNGTVRISGSKNATVALIPAAILANGPVTICGVPSISDVESLSVLLRDLGVVVDIRSSDSIIIDPTQMENKPLIHEAVNKLRASYYFMGALLGKYGHAEIRMPGGCYLGPRPIDLHLKGFEALGATIHYDHGAYILDAPQLIGNKIFLDIASVGATINIMMAAVHAQGRTTIENAAKEPEIIDVATLLNKMGAKIRGAGTNVITIDGVEALGGCFHEIIPDRIEAATYIVLAAAAADEVVVENVIPQHLESLLSKLHEIGVDIKVDVDRLIIKGNTGNLKATDIKTLPYPGFATDIQQPLTALLTQAHGQSIVTETIYTERFKHCQELAKMGANINVMIPSSFINGPTPLSGAEVSATDLRCGACLVIAGLIAEGTTTIRNIYHIERGYEHIDEKLSALGAKIWRETIE